MFVSATCWYLQKPEEGARSLEQEFEEPYVDEGVHTLALCKSSKGFSHHLLSSS